jgi:P27 family predicted phage terminase small subunit
MRGRKPVPTTLRKLHGNPRKVALPKSEPKPDGDLSEVPNWLTDELRTGWAYALANSPPGLLKRIDRGALIAWVVAEDLHRQAAIAQTKVGLLMRVKTRATMSQDDPGVPAASPYINIINQQAKIMLKAASELGFTPVSRPRVYGGPSVQAPHFGSGSNEEEDPDHVSLEDYLASAPKPPVIN